MHFPEIVVKILNTNPVPKRREKLTVFETEEPTREVE